MGINTYHIPVMLDDCIEALNIKPDGVYVDLTMGGGGHTGELERAMPNTMPKNTATPPSTGTGVC